MKALNVEIKKNGVLLVPKCRVAVSSLARIKGLIGETQMSLDKALLFEGGCQQMHSFFMKIAIDVVFIDASNKVISTYALKPWRITPFYFKAKKVLELPEGFCEKNNIQVGDYLEVVS